MPSFLFKSRQQFSQSVSLLIGSASTIGRLTYATCLSSRHSNPPSFIDTVSEVAFGIRKSRPKSQLVLAPFIYFHSFSVFSLIAALILYVLLPSLNVDVGLLVLAYFVKGSQQSVSTCCFARDERGG